MLGEHFETAQASDFIYLELFGGELFADRVIFRCRLLDKEAAVSMYVDAGDQRCWKKLDFTSTDLENSISIYAEIAKLEAANYFEVPQDEFHCQTWMWLKKVSTIP